MVGSGAITTYRELEDSANRFAHLMRERGVNRGDHIALMLDNDPRYYEVIWGALRSGIYVTPINWHLGAEEAGYIVEDCGASAFICSTRFAAVAEQVEARLSKVNTKLAINGPIAGFEPYEDAIESMPTAPIDDESNGQIMFYSSGTTGRPKGIKRDLGDDPYGGPTALEMALGILYSVTEQSQYLVPAPLYHAAPLAWSTSAQRLGATVVVMEQFDAAATLAAIEKHHVTHAQFVPTHFVRMLKLPEDERARYDVSSLSMVVHAAAPCPIEVKRAMMAWWGPIIFEYYAGSEGNGYCSASPEEWLAHPGTVGRPINGTVHVLGEDGEEMPVGETGQIWFNAGAIFEYHNDAEKTASAFNSAGWSTLGDVGYLDADGFVYLTDRISHMIISGGVNIYPQEVENLLAMHPFVTDVAVIGVPDEDFGEAVKAVVQLAPGVAPNDDTAAQIISYCQAHLAKFKCPRTVDFIDEMPRLPSGKLLKRQLRQRYWQN